MKKIILGIIPLVAIAIGVGMSSNVLAQPTVSAPQTTVDQPDGPNDVADNQNITDATHNGADNQKDGETNDDHNNTAKITSGDGDGEQPDATEGK